MDIKTERKEKFQINALTLHIFAMFCMVLDHAWATVVSGNAWMNFVGRLAFPIFAFMTVEGYFHTRSFKKYLQRLLIFALISEIPFNLMNSGSWIDPFHQNVLWTFIIALLCVSKMDKIRAGDLSTGKNALACAGIILLGFVIGTAAMVDYSGTGVLTVFVFYFFRGRDWKNILGQFLGIYLINFVLIQNLDIPFILFGHEFFFPTQGFAIFSLIPIWLYRGKQGPHNKVIQYACYAFYPVHILILSLLSLAGI